MTVTAHFPPNWEDRVVVGLNGKPTKETKRLLTAQAKAEGGSAKWNPLNSSLWLQNFTSLPNYNEIPVRNYTIPNAGVAATVLTLSQHEADGTLRYRDIVNQLQNAYVTGHTAEQMLDAAADNFTLWAGGNPNYVPLIREILKEV